MNDLLQTLRLATPIIQAPMGGGPGTPKLAAAVSNAGGLGSLAGAYLTPDGIAKEFTEARALTSGPLNINLFAGGYQTQLDRDPSSILALLGEVHEQLDIAPPVLPEVPPDPLPQQIEMVCRLRPEVFSFTFGIPAPELLDAVRTVGALIIGTATTMTEAAALSDAKIDAIVAQGAEAGAHRGTFLGSFDDSLVPTLELVRQISRVASIPVIASGGIMTGAEIAAALKAGASAVQLGTAFLACPEAGTSQAYREALNRAAGGDTVITRAYSGRAARGIRNTFIELVAERDELILPFPIQNSLTRSMRAAAAKAHNAQYLSLWAGTGVDRIRTMPATELIDALMQELRND